MPSNRTIASPNARVSPSTTRGWPVIVSAKAGVARIRKAEAISERIIAPITGRSDVRHTECGRAFGLAREAPASRRKEPLADLIPDDFDISGRESVFLGERA